MDRSSCHAIKMDSRVPCGAGKADEVVFCPQARAKVHPEQRQLNQASAIFPAQRFCPLNSETYYNRIYMCLHGKQVNFCLLSVNAVRGSYTPDSMHSELQKQTCKELLRAKPRHTCSSSVAHSSGATRCHNTQGRHLGERNRSDQKKAFRQHLSHDKHGDRTQ
jgi:hypothetical protein